MDKISTLVVGLPKQGADHSVIVADEKDTKVTAT